MYASASIEIASTESSCVKRAEADAVRLCILNPTSAALQGWCRAVGTPLVYVAATYPTMAERRAFLDALAAEMAARGLVFFPADA